MRILIHAHVYYAQIWPELAACIRNFDTEAKIDIFLSYPSGKPEIKALLMRRFPHADMMAVDNWGYDISPFLAVINKVDLDEYDYVVKLHTKRDTPRVWCNFHVYEGNEWRRELLSFCWTPRAVQHTLNAFQWQPRLGMVTAAKMIDPTGLTGSAHHLDQVKDVVRGLGLPIRRSVVTCGTMFIVRAVLLKVLRGNFDMDTFRYAPPPGTGDGIHITVAWECAFGMIVTSQGYVVSAGESRLIVPFRYGARYVTFLIMRLGSDLTRGVIRRMRQCRSHGEQE